MGIRTGSYHLDSSCPYLHSSLRCQVLCYEEDIQLDHEVPEIWEACLGMLRDELDRVMWNVHQKEYENPFNNSGSSSFKNEIFSVEAYDWSEKEQPWNFIWRGVEIKWYKHFGRGMTANQELHPFGAATMLEECLGSIRDIDLPLFLEQPAPANKLPV